MFEEDETGGGELRGSVSGGSVSGGSVSGGSVSGGSVSGGSVSGGSVSGSSVSGGSVSGPAGSGDDLGAVVGALVERSVALAHTDLAAPAGPELLGLVSDLVRVARRVDAAIAAGAWSLERVKAAEAASGLSAGSWLAGISHGCGGESAWRVRAGRLMERFTRLGRAVRDGELGLEHLRVLDEVRDPAVSELLAEQDGELVDAAMRVDLPTWRRQVRARATVLREELERRRRAGRDADPCCEEQPANVEPAEDAVGDPAGDDAPGGGAGDETAGDGTSAGAGGGARPGAAGESPGVGHPEGWLSVRATAGGGLLVRGELFGEPAERFRQALLAEASRQWRAAWVDHDRTGALLPAAAELRARALYELVRRGLGVECASSTAPRTDAVVVITVEDDQLAGRVRALDGEPLPVEVVDQLTCDANLQALLVGAAGQPLWMGRSGRLATAAQRRALAIRDGGCVFPGCTMPAEWCDVHHQPGWQHGGRTDLDRMVLLCRRHHGAVHTERWTLRPAEGPREAAVPGEVSPLAPPPERDEPGDGPPGLAGEARSGAGPPGGRAEGQRYEWHDRHRHRTLPAQQRGLRPAA